MNKAMIAAVGDRDSIMLWNSVGVRTVFATEKEDIERALHTLAKQGAAIIFITETAARLAGEAVDRYRTESYPAIIPIPGADGSDGLGMKNIYDNIEKAVGANILFNEEE